MTEPLARGSAPARVGLVGNPSDGFGGAVLALAWPGVAAEIELHGTRALDDHFDGPEGLEPLVHATRRRLGRLFGLLPARRLVVRTTIPREVGLAGSSAVVIATMRATLADLGARLDDDLAPAVALAVEVADLGIPGGLQDRVAQWRRGLVLCDVAPDVVRHVDGLDVARTTSLDESVLPELGVIWSAAASEPSAVTHGRLRGVEVDRRVRTEEMRAAGELARRVAEELAAGDATGLGAAMDRTFEHRRVVMDLQPRQAQLIEVARSVGAHANYAGSGGAVVCTRPTMGWEALDAAADAVGATVMRRAVSGPRS